MEHIIQFGVTIDEQKIIDTTIDKASRQIINNIQHEIDQYTRGWYDTKLDKIFREEVKKVVDANKEHIIEQSIKHLASNLTRTKAVKEMVARLEGDTNE